MDQFYELKRITATNTGTGNSYISVTGLANISGYTFEIRDSLWNLIPYSSSYVGGEYRLTPTGPLASSGVTFSLLYNGVVAGKITMVTCGILAGTEVYVV